MIRRVLAALLVLLPLAAATAVAAQAAEVGPRRALLSGPGNGPAVDLNFAANTAKGCGSFAACLTNTRSNATSYANDAAGNLVSFGANTLRITSKGLLRENATTNSCTQSQTFSTWSNSSGSNLSIATNAGTAPDGANTASTITEKAASQYQDTYFQVNETSGGNVAFSIYVKAKTGTPFVRVNISTAVYAVLAFTELDLSTGASRDSGNKGAGNLISSYVEPLANGWYRMVVIGNVNNSTNYVTFSFTSATGFNTFTGDGSTSVYIWGANCEKGASVASSYVPTTTAAVTRPADTIVLAGAALTAIESAAFTAQVETGLGIPASTATLLGVGTTTVGLTQTSGDSAQTGWGSGTLATANSGSWGTITRAAVSGSAAGRSVVLDGGTVASDSNAPSAVTAANLGEESDGSNGYAGYITRLAIWNKALPAAAMQANTLTTYPAGLAYPQIVASNGRQATAVATSVAAGAVRSEDRRLVCFGAQPTAYVQAVFAGFYTTTGSGELSAGNALTVEASLEIPTAPVHLPVRFLFSGATTGTAPNGSAAFTSDNLTADKLGYSSGIPAGACGFIQTSMLVSTGQNYVTYHNEGSTAYTYDRGEYRTTDSNASSHVMTPGSASYNNSLGGSGDINPLIAVVGAFTAPAVSLAFFGDSIAEGELDTAGDGWQGLNGGMFIRGAWNVGGANLPWAVVGISGQQAHQIVGGFAKRLATLKYATHVVVSMNSNDIVIGGRSASQIQTDDRTIWAAIAANASTTAPYIDMLLTPPRLSADSDSYETLAGQTVATNMTVGGERDTVNSNTVANVGSNSLSGEFDMNAQVADSGALDHWQVSCGNPAGSCTGTANWMTSDGLHPNSGEGMTAAAPVANSRFATYAPQRSGF